MLRAPFTKKDADNGSSFELYKVCNNEFYDVKLDLFVKIDIIEQVARNQPRMNLPVTLLL